MRPDFEKMYHIMFNASEQAINILIHAQQQCEELYMQAAETKPEISQIPQKLSAKKNSSLK